MSRYATITPEGTSDLLFRECDAVRGVEQRLSRLFKSRGFAEVITPALEFYDVFADTHSALPQEMMVKFIDAKGRILVLRPDCTTPIARLAATKLKSFTPPLRLFYNQSIYRISPSLTGRRDETTQCGVELIGVGGKKADMESLITALEALKNNSGVRFSLEIGHVGFYKSIIEGMLTEGLSLESQEAERIRGFIETKNYPALSEALAPYADSRSGRALLKLPELFGGSEVFETAMAVAPNETAVKTIAYLKDIYNELCGMGLKDNIMVDLGLVNQIHYYTGLVFRGFMQGTGETVLSGGRYDTLLSSFGADWPATGFAVNADAIAKATAPDTAGEEKRAVVFYENGFSRAAFRHLKELVDAGFAAEMSVFDTLEETRKYALVKKISRIDIVGESLNTVRLGEWE